MTNTSGISIDRGLPVPEAAANSKSNQLPYRLMEVGDSFAYPAERPQHHAYNSAQNATVRLHPKKFVARMTAGKARVWRIT